MYNYTTNSGRNIRDYRGLSTDEKPTKGVPVGSTWYDIDGNHDVYMYDGTQWVKQ